MATFQFYKSQLVVTYIAGHDENNEPIEKSKTFSNVKSNASADSLKSVALAFDALSAYQVTDAQKSERFIIV